MVLDEGHMIGLGEREVRYEAQIQRLLRRSDAAGRRIVCLSAILPDGHQLEDFAAWLTRDQPDGLIKDDWRPTRLRFGEVEWKGQHAQLNVSVGDEKPFIPKFVVPKRPTRGRARKLFPADQGELCIATAWRLVEEGQTVLVFCPMRRSVLPLAATIIEMHKRGHIDSMLAQPVSALATALAVGTEWFGPDHDILGRGGPPRCAAHALPQGSRTVVAGGRASRHGVIADLGPGTQPRRDLAGLSWGEARP